MTKSRCSPEGEHAGLAGLGAGAGGARGDGDGLLRAARGGRDRAVTPAADNRHLVFGML